MKTVTQVFATKIVDYGLKFGASVLIARFLGPADKGVLTFIQLVTGWIITFGNLSIYDANIFLLGSGRYGAAEVVPTTVLLSVVTGLVYGVIAFVLVFCRLVHWPVGHDHLFYLCLLGMPFTLIFNNAIAILQGLNLFKSFNILSLCRSALLLIGVLVAVGVANDHLFGIVMLGLVTGILGSLGLGFYLGRLVHWRLRLSFAYLKEAFLYGIRGHLRVLLVQVTILFDQFVLGAKLDPVYLGWYSVAVGLSGALMMLPDSVAMVLFPRVAAGPEAAGPLTARASRCTLLVMLFAALAGVLLSRPGIAIVYGQAFVPAAQPLAFLLVAVMFQAASRVLRNYLYGIGRPQLTLWSAGVASFVTLTAMFPMVAHFGMVGAAVTGVVAHGIGLVADLVLAHRVTGLPVRLFLWPQKEDLRLAAWKP